MGFNSGFKVLICDVESDFNIKCSTQIFCFNMHVVLGAEILSVKYWVNK